MAQRTDDGVLRDAVQVGGTRGAKPASAVGGPGRLHTPLPAVYLDQWVWIRLARAHRGRPARPADVDVLAAIRKASANGVAFPLSATHYHETLKITDPRQRRDLVEVMAPISAVRTIRSQSDLLRHQFLTALHETAGRPAIRPAPVRVLGLGMQWAFRGVPARFQVVDAEGRVVEEVDRAWLRHLNQHGEAELLGGPPDEELPALEALGYVSPKELDSQPGSRLAWEELLVGRLANRRLSREELRVLLLARELTHEYLDLLNRLLAEYRLTFGGLVAGGDPVKVRQRAVALVERVPTLRIAAEMKVEMFHDRGRSWTWNMVNDIDALSIAIPYCRLVITDRDAAGIARRTGADLRHGTTVISDLDALPELLDDLQVEARAFSGDPTGWDEVGPGEGFRLDRPPAIQQTGTPPGASVRLTDADDQPTAR